MKKPAQISGFTIISRACDGFTIIELIVVVAIIALLFGTGITAFNDFNRRQLVVQTAKNIKNELRIAQNKAITGEKDCSNGVCGTVLNQTTCVPGSKTLDGWYVNFTSNQIYGKCQGFQFGTSSFIIPPQITLIYDHAEIQFYPLTSGARASYICISGFNKIYKISVTTTGEIKDEGIVVNCSL